MNGAYGPPGVSGAAGRTADDTAGDVTVLSEAGHTLVLLHGDVDVRVTDDLEHAGRYAIDSGRPTLMDVRHVAMIDSVGISFVVRLAAGLRNVGLQLILRGPCPRVAELLTLMGADQLVQWVNPAPAVPEVSVMTPHIEEHIDEHIGEYDYDRSRLGADDVAGSGS